MPPSPAMRYSPGREIRSEHHKRGRSLEDGLLIRDKDDDLALFNEMQARERDNFLLHSTDDLDDPLSTKLRDFSDFKLGVSIPVRGESNDLLNADADKNDYDWLLTPPDTPLFSSLDDETPSNLSHRGRPRSQPISISRSASNDKSYRNNRGSASPHRLSPSPRSGNSTWQSRGRPLSAAHSSPTHILRPTTPSRSPSTPPKKLPTPPPRSSTPDSRRMSTGSSGTVASTGRRGVSPVKNSRGNSASPKLQAWQSTIPGFSAEAPPNLRTSLADRPALYVRGSSPASRNGRGLSPSSSNGRGLSPASSRGLSPASRNGRESSSKRQSMSPTASRSASSSHSHDRDRFSSQSKGSVASSGDDDIDSLQSATASISERTPARKIPVFANSRTPTFTKTPSRTSSSAPKRSFDSALRQMDRRSPQNMFRPLLSSVPSTTFYVGKTNPAYRPMISRNSSVTTSSNASSEQGASVAPDTEGSDHDQDQPTEWGKAPYPDGQDEVFIFDKVDEMNVGSEPDIHDAKPNIVGDIGDTMSEVELNEHDKFISDNGSAVVSESACIIDELPAAEFLENMANCSKCGKKYNIMAPMEENGDVCPDCSKEVECLRLSAGETHVPVAENATIHAELTLKENQVCDEMKSEKGVTKLQEFTRESGTMLAQDGAKVEKDQNCLLDCSLAKSVVEEEEHKFVDEQVVGQSTEGADEAVNDSQKLQHFNLYPSSTVGASEGVGISVLLKKSGSSKWPIVQGRSLTATSTPSDDLSYVRDSTYSMRSSIGHGSASASSSVDLSSFRQSEARIQRQSSSRKAEMESTRHDLNVKPLSRASSFSGNYHAHHGSVHYKSTSEENFDVSSGNVEFKALEETLAVAEQKVRDTESNYNDSSFIRTELLEENKFDCTESCRTIDTSALELSSRSQSMRFEDTSVPVVPEDDDCISSVNAEASADNTRSMSDTEAPNLNGGSFLIKEDATLKNGITGTDMVADPTHTFSRIGGCHECTPGSQTDSSVLADSRSVVDEPHEPSVPTISEKDVPVSTPESCILNHANDILEESTVTVEGPRGHMSRSLTFDEATDTDTILFCSSIVHSLAYQAATIALENESLVTLEGSRPTVAILGKSNPGKKDPRGRNGSKHTPKPHKSRQKRVETDVKPASLKTDTNVKSHALTHDSESPNKVDTARPPKLESKCNCTVM